jgi:hypothetical protein
MKWLEKKMKRNYIKNEILNIMYIKLKTKISNEKTF